MKDTFPSLFWGYAFIWTLLVVYVYSLGRRLANLERRMKSDGSE